VEEGRVNRTVAPSDAFFCALRYRNFTCGSAGTPTIVKHQISPALNLALFGGYSGAIREEGSVAAATVVGFADSVRERRAEVDGTGVSKTVHWVFALC